MCQVVGVMGGKGEPGLPASSPQRPAGNVPWEWGLLGPISGLVTGLPA